MDRIELQAKLDLQKWNDSCNARRDMCGTYDFCVACDKAKAYPCAEAYLAFNVKEEKVEEKPVAKKAAMPIRKSKPIQHSSEEVQALDSSLGKNFNYDKVVSKKQRRKGLTFAEKYALSSDIIKERYAILQAALVGKTKKGVIKSRISKQCDTYRLNKKTIAKITIIGTSLRINLALDPDAAKYNDGTMPHLNMGHKLAYKEVPFQFKVNSKLAVKRALELIEDLKNA